jgi:probable F420-dependent oxidoreductase
VSIGAKLTHTGPVDPVDVPGMAMALEAAGFASAWVSDHVVMPQTIASRYPFAADGRATWSPRVPYLEAVTVLAAAAAVTSTIRLGTAVLVLPQRNPVLTAKQLATVSALSGGRLSVGVGAGWLREEFDALHAPFEGRGANLETWVAVLRDCWTGAPSERREGYWLPAGMLALPAPPASIPVLFGGHSPRALDRAGRLGDGWLAQQALPDLDPGVLAAEFSTVTAAARRAGRPADAVACVLRIVGSSGRENEVAARLAELADVGVGEVIVDVDPEVGPADVYGVLVDRAAR